MYAVLTVRATENNGAKRKTTVTFLPFYPKSTTFGSPVTDKQL